MSFHKKQVSWEEFLKKYIENATKSKIKPLIAYHKGKRIAFISFNETPYEDEIEININMAPEARGKGLASEVINRSCRIPFQKDINIIHAYIKCNNIQSIKSFEKAGFYFSEKTSKIKEINSKDSIEIFRFSKQKTEHKDDTEKVFIIAEAGSNTIMGNSRLSMEMSSALIDVAVNAKADAVKFQLFNSKSLYVEEAGKAGYLSKRIKKESINEIIRSIELPTEIIKDISEYCSEKNIELMITPFSVDEAVIVNKYVKRHKLASAEITHTRLIEYMANTKKPVIISTGGASIEEIEWTVNHFYRNGGKDIAIMHCLLDYPAKPDSLNLNIIKGLKEHFCLKVGLSDHSLSFESVPVAAVSLGARIIEKHFTLSRKLPGPDNFYSLEPEELKKMVCLIRETEQILGKSIKTVQKNEFKLREFAQRSIQAITNIRKGELYKEGVNIGILRSGNKTKGIHPKFIADLEGKEARRNIRAGEGIMEEDK